MSSALATRALLTEEMLACFDQRAGVYDRENCFFYEDFEELRASGYLSAALPPEFGGPGLSLAEVGHLQHQLAYHAPATAIAINTHLYWTGTAADLWRGGDRSLAWLLAEVAEGEVFGAGHGETGNDLPVFLSTSRAERADGGWLISGHKISGSLSPVWTYLGVHAMDTSDSARPKMVHGFVPRGTVGCRIEHSCDVPGMRATESDDTILDRAFIPDELVALVRPAGFAGVGRFQLAVFAWGMLGFANVCTGIAQRAYDETVRGARQRSSIALTRSMAHHPEVQHQVAEMRMALETVNAYLGRLCDDWVRGVDHGTDWLLKIVTAKHVVVTKAWSVVDTALDLSGGAGIFRRSLMEQVFLDARLRRIHPANSALTHELVGKLSLGHRPRRAAPLGLTARLRRAAPPPGPSQGEWAVVAPQGR